MNSEAIEIQLWEYIDGTCSEAEKNRVAQLIATDAAWKVKYMELMTMHAQLSELIDAEQPSMRFTLNVMDEVAKTHIASSTKQYMNMAVIKGIAAFFIAAITAMLGYALTSANYKSNAHTFSSIGETITSAGSMINGTVLYTIIAINILLMLLLADALLRRQRNRRLPI